MAALHPLHLFLSLFINLYLSFFHLHLSSFSLLTLPHKQTAVSLRLIKVLKLLFLVNNKITSNFIQNILNAVGDTCNYYFFFLENE